MGKTAGGTTWLNADKLSEYDFWQICRNVSDKDVFFGDIDVGTIGGFQH
jgi:tyrosyl-tRNA synthetase